MVFPPAESIDLTINATIEFDREARLVDFWTLANVRAIVWLDHDSLLERGLPFSVEKALKMALIESIGLPRSEL